MATGVWGLYRRFHDRVRILMPRFQRIPETNIEAGDREARLTLLHAPGSPSWFYDIAKRPASPFERDGRRKFYDRPRANGPFLRYYKSFRFAVPHARGCPSYYAKDENAVIRAIMQRRIYHFIGKF